jgi:phage/plasmid primase-like uncharacterized protein
MSRLERIVRTVGGVLYDHGCRALVPGPGHSARDRSVSLRVARDGRLLVHCFSARDDPRAVVAWLKGLGIHCAAEMSPAPTACEPDDRMSRAQRAWREARALSATPAERYLQTRGIERPSSLAALRFHPRASSLDDRRRRPALIAAITDLKGTVQGVEITLLTEDGAAKARVGTPRRIVGRLSGGVVRLAETGPALLVAEGVVTALSASHVLRLPAYAALGAHNLARFAAPSAVERLIVAADNDETGMDAAHRLRTRLASLIAVEIAPPPEPFKDWNDWLCGSAGLVKR